MKKLLISLLAALNVAAFADEGYISLTNNTNSAFAQNIELRDESGTAFCNIRVGKTVTCKVDLFKNYTLSYYDNVRRKEVELFRLVSNGFPMEALVRQFDERLLLRKFNLTFASKVLGRFEPYTGGTANYQITPEATGDCATRKFKSEDPFKLVGCTLRGAENSGAEIAITVLEQ